MKDDKPDEGLRPTFVGHLLIRDPESGKVLLNKRDQNLPAPKNDRNRDEDRKV
jgi:hypothetical protein